jgi:hypothetical protein
VDESIDAYLELSEGVFKVDQVLAGHIPVGDNRCRFDYNILEGAIKNIIGRKLGDEDRLMNAIPKTVDKTCPTFVVAKMAADINALPTIFRTYRGVQVQPSKCAIWEAVRATSAAPTFFKPISIDRPRPAITYVDGGMGYNNPSELALSEARRIWPKCTEFGLVSIGSGRPKANSIQLGEAAEASPEVRQFIIEEIKTYLPNFVKQGWKIAKNLTPGVRALIEMSSALAKLASNSNDVHQRVQRASRSTEMDKQFPYFRFNVPRDVGDIGLGDWNKSEELAAYTNSYMKECETEEQRGLCVKFLLSASPSRT